ncbi:hypothetical protein F511_39777 [Dorcoceras hygrometricum]|uniref:Splicing factor 3B subunit 1-like n=1 Tax=Dorcoceras hygrometricum TaxID=472368 RepID=A0A2Z7APW2_9LAMI|nr:hypothetical protein F511_39777 [Dorcoceras hygrometricum]
MGKDIKIPGDDERTWYLASLTKIKPKEKGKKLLEEKDPVKGHPVKEEILVILEDIECLVQLREKIIDDVDIFINSFSFKKLASLKVEDISTKEELVLSWGEAESTIVALNRRMYILTKYRELLIKKILEARKINFAPGDGSSVVDLKVLDSTSCKKREIKIEFRLLSDILAKSIFVKAGSFDAVTHERFLLMAAITGGVQINWGRLLFNIFKEMVTAGSRQAKGYSIQICVLLKDVPGLELGDSKAFPSPRIMTDKTVHRYVVINEKVTVEEVTNKPRVKRTPVKKAVSRKRPATAEVVEPVSSKKKRTKVGKADKGSALITVAQEAVPLTIVEPTPAAPAEQPPVLKRKSKKRRLRLHKDSDDEIVKEQGAVEEAMENISEEQREATSSALVVEETIVGGITKKASEPTVANEPVVKSTAEEVRTTSADDVDLIIEHVIAETVQNETDEEKQNVDGIDVEGTTVS